MRCPYCSEEIEDGAVICKHCSSAVMEPARLRTADGAAWHLERAFALEDKDEYEKALEECETAIRLDPTLAGAHNLRGVILEELGRKQEAVLAYREALRLNPGFDAARENLQAVEAELQAGPHLERAFALEDEDKYEEALEECDAAIRLDPDLADAHNLRGVILEELGREEEAGLAYRDALRLDPGFDTARENLQAVEAELQAEENGRADQTSRFWVEEQVVFEAEYETGSYPWQLSRVEMDPVADAITIHGLPDGTPTIPIHLSEIARCEIVTRPDLRRGLANMWVSGAHERADGGEALLIVLTEIVDRIIAGSSKVPVLKLTHAGGSDSNPGLLEIHLRSMKRGRDGKIATLELGQRLAAFLRQAGWEGAIPEELSAPVDSDVLVKEVSARRAVQASVTWKWVLGGFLATFLAYQAGVHAAIFLFEPSELSRLLESGYYFVYNFFYCLPVWAICLLAPLAIVIRSIARRRSEVNVMVIVFAFSVLSMGLGCVAAMGMLGEVMR